jgi:hypothetical protein
MPDENDVIIDTPNDTVDAPATETAEERIARLEDANKKLFARTKKAEGFVQDANGNWVKPQKPQQTVITKEEPSQIKPMDILRDEAFKLYREGYDEDEIDIVIRNGGRKILEDKSHPITLGLQAKREQREAERAANAALGNSGLSEVERKYTPEQLANMSRKDLEKLLPRA